MATLDFTVARSQHLAWKLKLRDFLDGRSTLTLAQATSPKDCELGKWLYSTGLQKFAAVPGMRELEKVHAELHATIKRVIQAKQDNDAASAANEFQEFDSISDKIISLLKSIEKEAAVLTH